MKPAAIGAADLMHATLVRHPFNRAGWAFENKLDGFRALACREGDHVELMSRTGRAITLNFPEIAAALRRIPGEWVLDGELVVSDARGRPSFEGVRRRGVMTRPSSIGAAARETPAALYVFDLLVAQGTDLRPQPLVQRKVMLDDLIAQRALIGGTADLAIQVMSWLEGHGETFFGRACGLDLEGIVGKHLSAPYRRGLQRTWMKIKNPNYARQDALGFPSQSPRAHTAHAPPAYHG